MIATTALAACAQSPEAAGTRASSGTPTVTSVAAPMQSTTPSLARMPGGRPRSASAAVAEVTADLEALGVPPGGRVVGQAPSPLLDGGGGRPESPNLVQRQRWLLAPGSRSGVEAWFVAHPPPGNACALSGWGTTRGVRTDQLSCAGATPNAAEVELTTQQLGGQVGVAVEAWAVWTPPKQAADTVPTDGTSATLAYDGGLQQPGTPKPTRRTISLTGAQLAELAKPIDLLDVALPVDENCPNDDGEHARLTVRSAGHDLAYDIVMSGCEGVQVSRDGVHGDFLVGTADPQSVVHALVGVTPSPSSAPKAAK